jgi:hypothetical protein
MSGPPLYALATCAAVAVLVALWLAAALYAGRWRRRLKRQLATAANAALAGAMLHHRRAGSQLTMPPGLYDDARRLGMVGPGGTIRWVRVEQLARRAPEEATTERTADKNGERRR